MVPARIIFTSILAAIIYGILHDQVSARLCLEYFTVAHPRLVQTDNPTVHAILWGIIATWWVGAGLGTLLSIAARAGSRPKRELRTLLKPIGVLLAIMGGAALMAAALGYFASAADWVFLVEPFASRIPTEKHDGFIAAMWMHLASYGVGLIGGVVLAVRVYRSRVP